MQWLYTAKKRYGLVVLNYAVTSNHIHLFVADDKDRDVIPNSIKLIAGRTGQEFNQRKNRKGAFWEDRYHARAVENGAHLLQCLVYINLKMVRAGAVKHPPDWPYCGYGEIQRPKRKNILINYKRFQALLGFDNYENLQAAHKEWIASSLENGANIRDDKWTASLAVGSRVFVENVQTAMGASAIGRKPRETGESYQLREIQKPCIDDFGGKKSEIDPENSFSWH